MRHGTNKRMGKTRMDAKNGNTKMTVIAVNMFHVVLIHLINGTGYCPCGRHYPSHLISDEN